MSNQNGTNGSAPTELARVRHSDHSFFYGIALLFRWHSFYNIWHRYKYYARSCFHDLCGSNPVWYLQHTAIVECQKPSLRPDRYMRMRRKRLTRISALLRMDDRAGIHVPANVELSGIRYFYAGCTSEHTSLGMGCTF